MRHQYAPSWLVGIAAGLVCLVILAQCRCVYVAGDAVGIKAGGSASRPAGPPTTQAVEEPSIKDLIKEHL